jgi:hypothetical protein
MAVDALLAEKRWDEEDAESESEGQVESPLFHGIASIPDFALSRQSAGHSIA